MLEREREREEKWIYNLQKIISTKCFNGIFTILINNVRMNKPIGVLTNCPGIEDTHRFLKNYIHLYLSSL